MKPGLAQLEAFTVAARERGFSRAATVLGITQSAVTQHVAKLERLMGVPLFVRRRGGLELTRPGQDLFELTDRVFTLTQLVGERLQAYGAIESGHLRVIANAPRPVLPLIAAFNRRYPGVRVAFSLHSWSVAMQRLRGRDVDIAVVTEPEHVEGMYELELERACFMAYLRGEHPLARQKTLSLRDLAQECVVLPEGGSLTRRAVSQALARNGLALDRVMEMTSYPVVKEAVLHGVGVGLLLGASFFPSRQLVVRPIAEMPEAYRTVLVTPADKRALRIVRAFIDVAEESVG
ncbi:LysR substrate-binding domain-containing protein [Stappia sp. TSB10GB4]|uniref:LysR substrate-binding domain-containing protein n=1 Tax=Stappia sp. TSB10GB4 TaxID=2003584 RepID=UPI002738FFA0|nr:LysR substrate-binding domain-containing protein [Stappia sp. TSB10GB4]